MPVPCRYRTAVCRFCHRSVAATSMPRPMPSPMPVPWPLDGLSSSAARGRNRRAAAAQRRCRASSGSAISLQCRNGLSKDEEQCRIAWAQYLLILPGVGKRCTRPRRNSVLSSVPEIDTSVRGAAVRENSPSRAYDSGDDGYRSANDQCTILGPVPCSRSSPISGNAKHLQTLRPGPGLARRRSARRELFARAAARSLQNRAKK